MSWASGTYQGHVHLGQNVEKVGGSGKAGLDSAEALVGASSRVVLETSEGAKDAGGEASHVLVRFSNILAAGADSDTAEGSEAESLTGRTNVNVSLLNNTLVLGASLEGSGLAVLLESLFSSNGESVPCLLNGSEDVGLNSGGSDKCEHESSLHIY